MLEKRHSESAIRMQKNNRDHSPIDRRQTLVIGLNGENQRCLAAGT